ncbi:MAG: hypothetical protein IJO17_07675 [Alistipes sp.]|nr:hypothetical protein [Alistipes sp.]
MIKKTIYILLLICAVVAVAFAAINRPNTHTLLPIKAEKSVEVEITEPDSLTIEPDSVELSTVEPLQ